MSEAVRIDPAARRHRAIVVLGMHRSGTSALTRLVNLMGAELSDHLMKGSADNNETGFWEHQDIVDLHQDVLACLDRSWDDPRAIPDNLGTRADLAPLRQKLIGILKRDFVASPLWAVKDPRMCRLLPLWRDAFASVAAEPMFLILLRNPMEVARSLERRDGFALGRGLLLWLRHALDSERATRGQARLFLRYESIVEDWRPAVGRIGEKFDIAWPRAAEDAAPDIAKFLSPRLRHHHVADADLLGDQNLSRWVRTTHAALLDAVETDGSEVARRLDAVADELAAADALFGAVITDQAVLADEVYQRGRTIDELREKVAERDFRIVERDHMLAEKEKMVAEQAERVRDRDSRVAERDMQLAERDRHIRERDRLLTERSGEVARMRARIEDLEIARHAIFHSTSWRITAPVRGAVRLGRWLTEKIIPSLTDSEGRAWLAQGIRRAIRDPRELFAMFVRAASPARTYEDWIRSFDTLQPADRSEIAARIAALPKRPLISILMPVYNSPEAWLKRAIDSVTGQLYGEWELCIADDASTAEHVRAVVESYRAADPRIKIVYRPTNGHIAQASNSALELATGDFVALLDHDDELTPHALYMMAEELAAHPDADILFSDEDKIDEAGKRFGPYFKTDYNPDLQLSHHMIGHFAAYRRSLVTGIGGFRAGFEGSQDYDLTLRCIEATQPHRIRHIPFILYHWRAIQGSVALASDQKGYAHEAGRLAIEEHLARRGIEGAKVLSLEKNAVHRVVYPLPARPPKVSIIIPTRDRADLMTMATRGLTQGTDYPDWEAIIVDNGSVEPATKALFASLRLDPRFRILPYDRPFNYSAINNAAVREAQGEVICLLNNDIEPIDTDWLREMVSHAVRPGIGAVGAKLYYPDGTLQHGGVIVGMGGVAGHFEKHLEAGDPGYCRRVQLLQNLTAVTAACMVVRRSVFEDVGGLDEINLTVAFNDIDFCLRLAERGYRNVWTPFAELYHHESASRGADTAPEKVARFAREIAYMKRRWGRSLLEDPCFSPNLSLDTERIQLAYPPRVAKPWQQSEARTPAA
jgi:GT2 family glycosyltransferase